MAGRPRQIPAAPASDHAKALKARGLTVSQIAREAGLEPSTIRRLIGGQREILATNAAKVLSIPLTVRVSLGDVPALGATRRIRALYALGHLNWRIAQEAGISRDAVYHLAAGNWPTLKVAMDDGVRTAYDRLSMQTGTSWKTRRLAERSGWAPPLAWDDDVLDDPNGVPQTDAPEPVATEGGNVAARWLLGESVILGAEDRKEVIQHLFEWTQLTKEEIAERLEMKPSAVEQIWSRLKRQARLEGQPVPQRRVYALRDKDLSKKDMEEAA